MNENARRRLALKTGRAKQAAEVQQALAGFFPGISRKDSARLPCRRQHAAARRVGGRSRARSRRGLRVPAALPVGVQNMSGPRDLPDVRHRDLPPFDYDDDGIAGYLPELRDERVHKDDEENEDEAGL